MTKLTKDIVEKMWKQSQMPLIRARYELDGVPDYPARNLSWSVFVDLLHRDRHLTDWQVNNWAQPRMCVAPWNR